MGGSVGTKVNLASIELNWGGAWQYAHKKECILYVFINLTIITPITHLSATESHLLGHKNCKAQTASQQHGWSCIFPGSDHFLRIHHQYLKKQG